MLEMIFKGQVLTPDQLKALETITLDSPNLSAKAFRKEVDRALTTAGLPVQDIGVGQLVTWTVGTEKDKGKVVSYDERADKYRVISKLKKREVTVTGRDIRVAVAKGKVNEPTTN